MKGSGKMENMQFCQSCGMPLQNPEDFGTNAGGGKNEDYCVYCFKEGAFTTDVTMEDMIEECIPFMTHMSPNEARALLQSQLPKLKRWQTKA
jgi:hypothetical protein